VSAAIHRFEGQAMTYVPERGPCYRCLFPNMAEGVAPNCAEAGVLGVLPGVLGAIQATEAIKLVVGIGTPLIGRLLTYDALDMRFQELACKRRVDCAVCGEHPSITAPQDPAGFCTAEELRRVRSISARQLAQRIQSDGLPIRVIDVREPAEFAASHLPRAINIPLDTVEQHARQLPHAGAVVFVCRSGVRSRRACALADRMGVSEAWQLEGGLLAWKAEVDPSLRL
jgi:adenylyltransferase/sulfurtransferase